MSKAINLALYYTAAEAAEVISRNSGKLVSPTYMRNLARYGVITTVKVGHSNLYLKTDVDKYKVEARGEKARQARENRGVGKEEDKTAA